MKNISFYKIAFIIAPMFIIFSCAKEKDITKTTIIKPPPVENTDIFSIQGIVKDTLGQVIGGVSLKAYFDDFEIETMSDMNGNYEFKIPKSKTEGYIIAAKEKYSRSIKSVKQTSNNIEKSIFLVENQKIESENLKLEVDSLLTIKGRTIDETGQPVEGAFVLFTAFNTQGTFEVGALGFTDTDEMGNFEIIVNEGDYWVRVLRANYPSICGSKFNTSWSDETSPKDLGDITIELNSGTGRTVTSTINQLDCGSNDGYAKYYFTDRSTQFYNWEKPLGDIGFDYCDNGESNVIFVGTHSRDLQNFNGRFYKANDLPAKNEFDICTPAGYFFEMYKNGVLTTGVDGNVQGFATPGNVTLSTDTEDIIFLEPVTRNIATLPDFETKIITGFVQGLVTIDSDNNSIEEHPGSTDGLYLDYVQNTADIVAGIIQGQMEEKDTGTINEYFIRFRMPYQ